MATRPKDLPPIFLTSLAPHPPGSAPATGQPRAHSPFGHLSGMFFPWNCRACFLTSFKLCLKRPHFPDHPSDNRRLPSILGTLIPFPTFSFLRGTYHLLTRRVTRVFVLCVTRLPARERPLHGAWGLPCSLLRLST